MTIIKIQIYTNRGSYSLDCGSLKNIIQRLIRLVILTEQERIEAGIYLDHPHI